MEVVLIVLAQAETEGITRVNLAMTAMLMLDTSQRSGFEHREHGILAEWYTKRGGGRIDRSDPGTPDGSKTRRLLRSALRSVTTRGAKQGLQ